MIQRTYHQYQIHTDGFPLLNLQMESNIYSDDPLPYRYLSFRKVGKGTKNQ